MDLNNLILFFFLVVLNLFFYKYFFSILYKYNPKILIDDQFQKPQAFHESAISIGGGVTIFFSSVIITLNFWFFKNVIFLEYLSICTLLFIIGFADDIRVHIKPSIRLTLMIMFLLFFVWHNNFYIE